MIRPINDSILFAFLDAANSTGFSNTTESGIVYKSLDEGLNAPRWGKVLAVGPKVIDVKPGMTVLIGALRWTEGFKHDGVSIWKTVEHEILAIREQ